MATTTATAAAANTTNGAAVADGHAQQQQQQPPLSIAELLTSANDREVRLLDEVAELRTQHATLLHEHSTAAKVAAQEIEHLHAQVLVACAAAGGDGSAGGGASRNNEVDNNGVSGCSGGGEDAAAAVQKESLAWFRQEIERREQLAAMCVRARVRAYVRVCPSEFVRGMQCACSLGNSVIQVPCVTQSLLQARL